jgi:hypothetical protein
MYASIRAPWRGQAFVGAGSRSPVRGSLAHAAGSPAHAAVLALQREAGNAAVAEALQVQRQEREARTADVIEAKPADAPRRFLAYGPPPKLLDPEEASYKSKGESKLADLGGGGTASTAGDTKVGPIEGFPDWFANLQSALIGSTDWRKDKEEPAQNLLAEYGLKRFALPHQGDQSKIPPTVRIFLQHIGRSTSNVTAATAAGLPSSGDLGGGNNAKSWCAQAGSSSVQLAIQAAGLTFDETQKKGWNAWLIAPPGVPQVGMVPASVDEKIEIGDQVSYLENGILAIGGHTVTALSVSSGDGSTFDHASGNAGGGTSGSVRLGSSPPRAKLPSSITLPDIQTKSAATLGAPAGKIWIYIVVKYSKFWADLGAIDTTAAGVWQTEAGKAFLKTYKLKPAPVKA